MQQEAVNELLGRERDTAQFLAAIVAIAKGHLAMLEVFEATVGNGDAEEVTGQILEHLETLAGALTIDDPVFAPHWRWHLCEQAGALEGGTELGAKDKGECFGRH
jgi:hypothetical protein